MEKRSTLYGGGGEEDDQTKQASLPPSLSLFALVSHHRHRLTAGEAPPRPLRRLPIDPIPGETYYAGILSHSNQEVAILGLLEVESALEF